jgi:adenylylsulfate kinase
MVYWITGRKGSGKTTLAKRIAIQTGGVIVDGDAVREFFPSGYTYDERVQNQRTIAHIAKLIENQGKVAIIACVSPILSVRKELQAMFDECLEIELPGGTLWPGTTYEETPYEFAR